MNGPGVPSGRRLQRLLRSLGEFDLDGEVDAALARRVGPDGTHPPRYDLELFAADDLADGAAVAAILSHLEDCAACRSEVKDFRALLEPATTVPSRQSGNVVDFSVRRRPVFRMPAVAAAAGGDEHWRGSPEATIRIVEIGEPVRQLLIAIQLADRSMHPRRLRLLDPSRPALEQELPPPDHSGLIQFVVPADQAFFELLKSAPLEFWDGPNE